MIRSKYIEVLTFLLVGVAILFLIFASLFADQVENQTVIKYTDAFSMTYTEADYDMQWENGNFYTITLMGDSAQTNSGKVYIDGGEISILGGGTYVLSGELNDGSIIVDVKDDSAVHLVLCNASITSSDFSALYIAQAEYVILTLAENTENYLQDGATYLQEKQTNGKPFATIYSKDNLTINGTGLLTIAGNYEDGIKCNDTMKIMSGTINITAIDDAINVNDDLAILDATITVNCGDDALHSDGNIVVSQGCLVLSAGDDAIHADRTVYLAPTSIRINKCEEGIEGAYVIIDDGEISIVSHDDGLNGVGEDNTAGMGMPMRGSNREITEENTYLVINGGSIYIETSGDGIDSNGAVILNGGMVTVYGPESNGDASLDFEYGMLIHGGTLLAAGSSGMAELPDTESKQNVLVFYLSDSYSAGNTICVKNQAGDTIVEGTSSKKFDWVCVSTDDILQGETYTLYINEDAISELTSTGTVSSSGGRYNGWTTQNDKMTMHNVGRRMM